jgi:hypothetical protein
MEDIHSFLDHGFKSKKLWFTVFVISVLTLVTLLAQKLPVIVGIYPVFVGGLTGLTGMFLGADHLAKSLVTKFEGSGEDSDLSSGNDVNIPPPHV